MEIKKSHINVERQMQYAVSELEAERHLISRLREKIEELDRLQTLIKDFFQLDPQLDTRGVFRAVERINSFSLQPKS